MLPLGPSSGGIAFQRKALPSVGALHDVLPAVDHVSDRSPLTADTRFTSQHLTRLVVKGAAAVGDHPERNA